MNTHEEAHGPVRNALEVSVNAAYEKGRLSGLDAGAVQAARALADRIDASHNNDNVSAPVFLKYLEHLRLTPASRKGEVAEEERANQAHDALAILQEQVRQRTQPHAG